MASIVFTLKPTSPGQPCKVEADVQGMTGPACVSKLQPFLDALGTKNQTVTHKPEYAEATVNVERG